MASDIAPLGQAQKLYIYLDHNVLAEMVGKDDLREKFQKMKKGSPIHFPYSAAHIFEVRNILSSKNISDDKKYFYVQQHLELIKDISESWFVDFREGLDSFTIRLRDPFEVYKTIQEVPQAFEMMNSLGSVITKDMVIQARETLGLTDLNFNNLSPDEAKELINQKLSSGIEKARVKAKELGQEIDEGIYSECSSFDGLLRLVPRFLPSAGNQKSAMISESALFEILGYQAAKKESKKSSARWDSEHYAYAQGLAVFISKDIKLLKRLGWIEGQSVQRQKMYFELDEFLGFFEKIFVWQEKRENS